MTTKLLAQMPLAQMPCHFYSARDSRPENSDADPTVDVEDNTLGHFLNPRQLEILSAIISNKRVLPVKFLIYVSRITTVYPTRLFPAYSSTVIISCFNEDGNDTELIRISIHGSTESEHRLYDQIVFRSE